MLEDDHDGEFRYDHRAVGAAQALDPDHVAYLGTASKSLAPAVGLAWAVVPQRMISGLAEARRVAGVAADAVSQLALADFIESHRYDRHVRRLRAEYRRRRELLDGLMVASGSGARVRGLAAGLHCVVELPAGVAADAVVAEAARREVAVEGLAAYAAHATAAARTSTIVVGYGAPPARVADEAIAELVAAIASVAPPRSLAARGRLLPNFCSMTSPPIA